MKTYLPTKGFERVIHAFITCRLDCCNSLLWDWSVAAASLTNCWKKEETTRHFTPVLASLHWLPFQFRIQFKILLLVFETLNSMAPPYLCELLNVHCPVRALRSSKQLLLTLLKSKLKSRRDTGFSVVAHKLWNSLTFNIRSAQTAYHLKPLLKTHLFSLVFAPSWAWYLAFYCIYICVIHILFMFLFCFVLL